jgi:GNAT superfamily N-acetyltransferase
VDDLEWLVLHDGHLGERELGRKIDAGEVLVAESDGERLGLLRLDHLWSSVPFVALLRVLPEARRRGAGRALVEAARALARGRGAPLLLSSATGNEPDALAWHRAVGFEEWGVLPGLNPGGAGEVFFRIGTDPRQRAL